MIDVLANTITVPFEILGMVGETIHIKNTIFRMLPNPTVFRWDPTTFSLPAMINSFHAQLKELWDDELFEHSAQTSQMIGWMRNRRVSIILTTTLKLNAIKEDDSNKSSLFDELDYLRTGIELCDEYLKPRSSTMLKVLRVHIQEVLHMLNISSSDAVKMDGSKEQASTTDHGNNPVCVDDIDSAFYKDREDLLIRMYFESVRQNVCRIVCEQDEEDKRRSFGDMGSGRVSLPSITPGEANDVWCTLLFRMLCWLQLHNFHRMDVHVTKSDAYGSRIPAYII